MAALVNYDFGELDETIPAYAISIHKSQGSEYPAVVIPPSTQHYPMLRRNLVYTGITRGKQLVGQRKALTIAVREFASRAQVVKTESMATWRSRARGVNNPLLFRLG